MEEVTGFNNKVHFTLNFYKNPFFKSQNHHVSIFVGSLNEKELEEYLEKEKKCQVFQYQSKNLLKI